MRRAALVPAETGFVNAFRRSADSPTVQGRRLRSLIRGTTPGDRDRPS
jgi:hypothetical protein